MLPPIRADAIRLERLIDLVLGSGLRDAVECRGSVQSAIEVGRGFVAYRVTWPTIVSPDDDVLDLGIARGLARQLGGEMQVEHTAPHHGNDENHTDNELTVTLIFPVDIT